MSQKKRVKKQRRRTVRAQRRKQKDEKVKDTKQALPRTDEGQDGNKAHVGIEGE